MSKFPSWYDQPIDDKFKNDKIMTRFEVETYATSGTVSTKYFGEDFQPELLEKNVMYQFYLWTPEIVWDNPNVTLHLDLEKVSFLELSEKDSYEEVSVYGFMIPPEMTTFNYTSRKGSGPGNYRNPTFEVGLERNIVLENLDLMNQEKMPGFRLKWYYTGAEFSLDSVNDTFLGIYEPAHYEFVR